MSGGRAEEPTRAGEPRRPDGCAEALADVAVVEPAPERVAEHEVPGAPCAAPRASARAAASRARGRGPPRAARWASSTASERGGGRAAGGRGADPRRG